MTAMAKTLADALSTSGSNGAASIELALIKSASPLVIEHRGMELRAGVGVLTGVTPVANKSCLVAVFGAASRIIIGVISS